ncbi:Uncharacterised protein [Salmonella enterica subsp. enterica serovar Typhi]|nr:Uncharacterised protein [Salmonella enterica subsp. enterica serovar Typhi]CGX55236.1 Uncharacterised protein [Salmonella enterica subsp. enterica serovar Typhi]CGZ65854.1 Uncharacterised protein [Salmonella enterica subsp. enterica serovar Typhi]
MFAPESIQYAAAGEDAVKVLGADLLRTIGERIAPVDGVTAVVAHHRLHLGVEHIAGPGVDFARSLLRQIQQDVFQRRRQFRRLQLQLVCGSNARWQRPRRQRAVSNGQLGVILVEHGQQRSDLHRPTAALSAVRPPGNDLAQRGETVIHQRFFQPLFRVNILEQFCRLYHFPRVTGRALRQLFLSGLRVRRRHQRGLLHHRFSQPHQR